MRRPFLAVLILTAGCALAAGAASAQSWGHNRGQGHHHGGSNWAPSAFDWRSQLDRPGDYRCDAFWDASRTDCDARWRRRPLVLTDLSMTPGLGPKTSEPEILCWDMNALPDPPPPAGQRTEAVRTRRNNGERRSPTVP